MKKKTKYREIMLENGHIVDITLEFGSWKGQTIREMVEYPDGLQYITNFILNEEHDFDEEFKTKIMNLLDTLGILYEE